MRYIEAVRQDERENGHDDAIEEEIGEESYANSGDDEEGIAAPFQADWGLGKISGHDYALRMFEH